MSRRASVFAWAVALIIVLSLGLAFGMSYSTTYNALVSTFQPTWNYIATGVQLTALAPK